MIKTLLGIFLCSSILFTVEENGSSSTQSIKELDAIDAYKLKIENVELFGNVSSQMELFGLPEQVLQLNKKAEFTTVEDVVQIIKKSIDYTVVKYPGIDFWCFNDMESIPFKVDFRKLGKGVTNGRVTFSAQYEINDFSKDYPNSFANSPQIHRSFFEMTTLEQGDGLKHFYVERATKSDPNVKLLIEFTFKNDKLIYIFFANF